MKSQLFAVCLVALLAACSQESTPTAPAAAAEPAPVAAAPVSTAAPTVSNTSQLPQECEAYLERVQACVGKQNGQAADMMKTNLDQVRATWSSAGADKSQLIEACKAANEAFNTQASMMKC